MDKAVDNVAATSGKKKEGEDSDELPDLETIISSDSEESDSEELSGEDDGGLDGEELADAADAGMPAVR